MNKKLKFALIIVLVVLIVYAGGFLIWSQQTFKPTSQLNHLVNLKQEVQHKDDLHIYKPKSKDIKDGFIFIPELR